MPARTQRTLGAMVEHGFTAFVRCPTCGVYREVDLSALIARVGPDYSLWNRRCRCKLTAGCSGWNRFLCGPGWHTPLYDLATEARWIDSEFQEKLDSDPALRAAVERIRR